MKHLFLIIIFILGSSFSLIAQFNLGVKAGVSFSNVKFSGIDSPSNYRTGLSVGVPISYEINKRVRVGINTEFIQKGYNSESNGQPDYTQYNNNYVQITPNIDFLVIKELRIGIGLYYAIKIGEYLKVGKDDWIDTRKFKIIKNNDFGISPTIGYSYKNLHFQLSYQYGMRNIGNIKFADSNGIVIPGVKMQNKVFEIGLAYLFKINGKSR